MIPEDPILTTAVSKRDITGENKMDRNGTTSTKMMSAKEEIDSMIVSLINKKVLVFVTKGRYTEKVEGTLKAYDGKRVLVEDAKCSTGGENRVVVCFLGRNCYIASGQV